MESRLYKLFDYQRYEKDPELQEIIDDVLHRYRISGGTRLSDEELEYAAAAGDPNASVENMGKGYLKIPRRKTDNA